MEPNSTPPLDKRALRLRWRRGRDAYTAYDGRHCAAWFGSTDVFSPKPGWEWHITLLNTGFNNSGLLPKIEPLAVAFHVEREYFARLPHALGLHLRVEEEVAFFEERGMPLPESVQWRKERFLCCDVPTPRSPRTGA